MKKKSHRFGRWNIWRGKFRMTVFPLILRLAAPLVYARRTLWPHKVLLSRVEGAGKDGRPLAILCTANAQNKNYFLGLVFDGPVRESELGQFRLKYVFRANRPAEKDCSLAVVETNQSHHAWLNTGNWFFIPAWVTGRVALPVPDDFLRRDTVRTTIRKIRRHGFEYEVTQDEKHFDDFYHNMHVPYISKVHGNTAVFDACAEKRRLCENYDLLLVRKRSQPGHFIAGFLIVYEPAAPRLWSLGVRDGNLELVREGALAAMYLFCFEHLMAKGFSRVNMGSSKAFLQDGVLKFKRKLSQSISGCSWEGFALKILSLTPAARNFLQNNPFIFLSGGRLNGAAFTEDKLTPEKIREIYKDDFHPGLSKLVIFSFAGAGTMKPDQIPPELAGQIEIRPAGDLLSSKTHLP